jgi:hypothetical protein
MRVTQIRDEYSHTILVVNLPIGRVRKQLKEAGYKYNKYYDCYYIKSYRTDWNYLVPEDYVQLVSHTVKDASMLNKFIASEVV